MANLMTQRVLDDIWTTLLLFSADTNLSPCDGYSGTVVYFPSFSINLTETGMSQ